MKPKGGINNKVGETLFVAPLWMPVKF